MGLQPAKLLVAAVVLLNEHSGPPALLELFLFVVAAELTLDKDGGLRHLLIKCILVTRTERHVILSCVRMLQKCSVSGRTTQPEDWKYIQLLVVKKVYLQDYPC